MAASALVDAIIQNALSTASTETSNANSAAQQVMSAANGYAMSAVSDINYTMTATEPVVPEVGDAMTTYESQRDKMIALLSAQLADFFRLYYPLASDAFDKATNWLVNTITLGGTGINPAVEAQIWQRGRDRIVADSLSTQAQIMDDFASRGFSLPAGAMAARIDAARFDQAAKLQEQSRDVAIKQAEIEIENLRFAVEQAVKSRMQAMQAAVEYIRSLMSGPEIASKLALLNAEAKARMMSATADMYRARLSRDEIAMKIPLTEAELGVRSGIAGMEGFYHGMDSRVRAAAAAADVYGRAAQAALASLTSVASTTISAFSA